MSYFMVDVEADGPIPGEYSMISLGVIIVEPQLDRTFYGQLRPISERWQPKALSVSGFGRDDTLEFDAPEEVMKNLAQWVQRESLGKPIFISDNNGFDWQFINYYFHRFLGSNPFGFSSTNLGSLYKGVVRNLSRNFKHLRVTKHTHHPVDDARGNAEALLSIAKKYDLNIRLK
ncbi:MAG: 3'-5' exoribonuclease [Mariniblastus sp.]|nr:3'-5' exoribonuclease [Mariniblastus sp.]